MVLALAVVATWATGLVPGRADLAQARATSGDVDRVGLTTKIDWRNCGVRLQCGRVRVPLDWSHPDERSITLPVVRHLASRRGRRLGSLFVNGGGARGSTELVMESGADLDALGQGRFDVVGWALRGTGGSAVVRCFADERARTRFWGGVPLPETSAQALRHVPKIRGYAERCAARNGSLLAHVSTADDARDLDYLRALVGDRKLTYRAVSYGTFLGLTYANLFPDRVRAMAVDGLLDPRIVVRGAEARFADGVVGQDAALRAFESVCRNAGAARCALAGHGSAADRVERLLAELRRRPVAAPTAQPPGALTYGEAALPIFIGLQNPALWPGLARDLDHAANGDGSALATLARTSLAAARTAPGDPPEAKICADSPARQRLNEWPDVIARLARVSRIGGPFVGWTGWAPCAAWLGRRAQRYTGPWNATTRNPILVIGTRHDPSTRYVNARRVSRLLGNAVLLTHDGYGHTSDADPSRCVERATAAYLAELRTPRPGTVCRSDRQPFDPRFGDVGAPEPEG